MTLGHGSTADRRAAALGLAAGFGLDQLLGDPRRGHPVAGFGAVAARLERRTWADRRAPGVLHVGVLVAGTAGLGALAERAVRGRPVARLLLTAAATWTVLGGRSLQREARTLARQLSADDLPAARRQIRNLVGRDPSELDAEQLARACVESVAENTADAVVAPLVWGALLGLPGLLGYRAVNTLDAMVGHRSPRYRRFGWAAARLDDVANWVPARVCGLLTVALAPLVGGRPGDAWRAWRRDAGQHPSPNAGVVEATAAGALGVRLGGRNVYGGVVEDRGVLGRGRTVAVADIAPAARLSLLVGVASALLATGLRAVAGRER
ncbi:adenosylcobinamide-phosphate synthase [Friedmanniella luteola]|uniref:Cobalamin biosynthesis protein CobD n=1 Tax=Friedmanniella luteola TaxID=546871 RepID=A0A1H2A2H8_9ACTN|nr:cobalamin biosynthesis protein [Friedmanniella luteola]SDT40079.1 adenosylcobinamide-phosphate synthase [Friedmanniella luteola]